MQQEKKIVHIGDNGQIVYFQQQKLGWGSFGDVYKGLYGQIPVAIKKLKIKPSKSEKNNAQKQCLFSCNHPNIVSCYNFIQYKNQYYLITQLCNKRTLENQISDKMSQQKAFQYAYQLVDGLQYIHSKNIMHRDIKPGNILISQYGQLKIADFGVAKFFLQEINKTVYDTPGKTTHAYSAPNVFDTSDYSGYYSAKCDVWAIGLIFYEMLFGINIFKANNIYLQEIKSINQFKEQQKKVQGFVSKIQNIGSFWKRILQISLQYDEANRVKSSQLKKLFILQKEKRQQEQKKQKEQKKKKIFGLVSQKLIVIENKLYYQCRLANKKGLIMKQKKKVQNFDEQIQLVIQKMVYKKQFLLLTYKAWKIIINQQIGSERYRNILKVICYYLLQQNSKECFQFCQQFESQAINLLQKYQNNNQLLNNVSFRVRRQLYLNQIKQIISEICEQQQNIKSNLNLQQIQIQQEIFILGQNPQQKNSQNSKTFQKYFVSKKNDLENQINNLTKKQQLIASRMYIHLLLVSKKKKLFIIYDKNFAQTAKKIIKQLTIIDKSILSDLQIIKQKLQMS